MNNYDLIICVFGCHTIDKYKQQIKKINETWGKKCESYSNIKLLYYLGGERTDEFSDSRYIYLPNITNDYLSASYKQFLGLKQVYENFNTKFIICCGTDTYLNIHVA